MKNFTKFIITICIMLLSCKNSDAQLTPNDPIYTSVFLDAFSTSTVNSADWSSHYPWGTFLNTNINTDPLLCGGLGWDVPCLQMNLTDNHNIISSGGTCKLIGIKENVQGEIWTFPSPCTGPACDPPSLCLDPANPSTSKCLKPVQLPFKYSNGNLISLKKYKYGYFEIKFRLTGQSTTISYNTYTPSFWLFGGDPTVPWSEIDVFEIDASSQAFTNNIHVNIPPMPANTSTNEPFLSLNPIDLTQWHKASVNWTPDYIDFYLDNNFLRRSTSAINQNLIAMPLIIASDFPEYNFCVNIDPINTPFPITFEIDSVKIMQAKQDCSNKVYCNTSAVLFDSKLYSSVTIGGAGCSSIFNNAKAHAAGENFVLLDEGFEAGTNMEMTFDTPNCYISVAQLRSASEILMPMPSNFIQIYNSSRLSQH